MITPLKVLSSKRHRSTQRSGVAMRERRRPDVGLVAVAEEEHAAEVAFVIFGEAAMGGEGVGFAEGAEEAIPPRDVSVVEAVQVELVVDGVMFRALEEVTHPVRRAQIAVVEILAEDSEDVVPSGARQGSAEEREHQGADDHRVHGYFQRMFIESGQRFDTAGAVMNLVADAPEKIGIMPRAMPPVEDEGSNEPAEEAFQKGV